MNQHIHPLPLRSSRPVRWLNGAALIGLLAAYIWLFISDDTGAATHTSASACEPADFVLIPGGEFLMDDTRRGNDPDNALSHIDFRLVVNGMTTAGQ